MDFVTHFWLLLSRVLSDSLWPVDSACQGPLYFTVSQSLPKFMSTELVVLSNHLILCCPFSVCLQSFLASGSFPMSWLFTWSDQSIGTSASVLPMNIQGWFHQDWLIWSLCCPRDSQEFSPAPHFRSINSSAFSFLYGPTLTSIHDYWKNHSFVSKAMSLLNVLSELVIAFLPRSKHLLLLSWLQSPSTVILEPKKIKPVAVTIASPAICHEVMGPDAMILVFWKLSFKSVFSPPLSLFSRDFSASSFSAIIVGSSTYLRFPPAVLIPACDSTSPAFQMTYSAYNLNKQDYSITKWILESICHKKRHLGFLCELCWICTLGNIAILIFFSDPKPGMWFHLFRWTSNFFQ